MHHLVAAVPVREVEREHLRVREGGRELLDAARVRAVAAADEERVVVEPERVAAVDRPRRLDPGGDGDAGAREGGLERGRLAEAPVLARPQEDGALVADEDGVVGVDGVGVPRLPLRDDDLGAVAASGSGSARQPYSRQRAASAGCGGRTSTRRSGSVIERAPKPVRVPSVLTTRRRGAPGECDARTQGVAIAALWSRPRTPQRAVRHVPAARASVRRGL
jgi:hypothetical protein